MKLLRLVFIFVPGNSGLTYIIQVISKLLDPKTSEYTASFVGRLVTVVLIKVGHQLGEKMDLILRAVLSKMQQTETLSVMQVCDIILTLTHFDFGSIPGRCFGSLAQRKGV